MNEDKILKERNVYRVISYVFIFIFLILSFTFILSINMITSFSKLKPISNLDYSLAEKCDKETLEMTSSCLVNKVSQFYKYKEDKTFFKDFNNIKEDGTDCKGWSYIYSQYLDYLGINHKIENTLDSEGGHAFVIAWKEGIYCMIDQTSYSCN